MKNWRIYLVGAAAGYFGYKYLLKKKPTIYVGSFNDSSTPQVNSVSDLTPEIFQSAVDQRLT